MTTDQFGDVDPWARQHPSKGYGVDWRAHRRGEDLKTSLCGVAGLVTIGWGNPHDAARPIKGDYWHGVCDECLSGVDNGE